MNLFFSALTLLTLSTASLFADDAPPMAPQQSMWQTVIMVAIALAFFYLLLWRPEQKRRKAMDEQRAAMKQGDKVVAMGIIGTVVRIQDQTVVLKMVDGSKIEVVKGAITDVTSGEGTPAE